VSDTIKWGTDTLVAGCEQTTLALSPDDEGAVTAVLVRRPAPAAPRAVLYIHGFSDYFFQGHVAERFNQAGYHYYALDLRKYGRAWLPHQHPNHCRDVHEYFAEITAAIALIDNAHPGAFLLLAGHSTGGLTTSLYLHEGERRQRVNALWLNSPFFEFAATGVDALSVPVGTTLGGILPYFGVKDALSPCYVESLHQSLRGEWEFDLRLKPLKAHPVYFGWVRAIRHGHRQLQRGLAIAQPVLLNHSDGSVTGKQWDERYLQADGVLNVEHMKRYGPGIGRNVTVREIPQGLHDITLSRAGVRHALFQQLFEWLATLS
jgi:alpha-beta hydrolase superfamily lysophospholipase